MDIYQLRRKLSDLLSKDRTLDMSYANYPCNTLQVTRVGKGGAKTGTAFIVVLSPKAQRPLSLRKEIDVFINPRGMAKLISRFTEDEIEKMAEAINALDLVNG